MTLKQSVLSALEAHRGQPLSGQQLADTLGVSRAAVWKVIQLLQADGHQIDSASKRGYTLLPQSDIVSEEGVRFWLHQKEVTVHAAACVDSTNNLAKQLAQQGAPHGSIVAAGQQTAGRGRRGRAFSSPPDTGLYLSVILRMGVSMTSAALLTSAAAVAVCRALTGLGAPKPLQIKWVNDIYIGGKKCCGILTEAAADMETGCVDYVIVGIGVNVRRPAEGFSPELARIATAVWEEDAPAGPLRCRLAAEIANELLPLADALPCTDFMAEYRARNLVPGRDVTIVQNGAERPAHALSITEDAHLLVELPDKTREELSFGEVSLRL